MGTQIRSLQAKDPQVSIMNRSTVQDREPSQAMCPIWQTTMIRPGLVEAGLRREDNEPLHRESGSAKMVSRVMLQKFAKSWLAQLIVAAIAGMIVGLIAYSVSRIAGRSLFIITGGIAGLVAVLALQFYRRAAQLTEIKISVPQFSELTFVVNNDARQVAWKLFVETVTRISTQPLDDDKGFLREALTSLYSLFAMTRETLKDSRPSVPARGSQTVEHLAVTMLNRELRPFLSKWHPRLTGFEKNHPGEPESAWEDATDCRLELGQIQRLMRDYALGFARLAGVRDAESMLDQPN
jgi:hypothetical protein